MRTKILGYALCAFMASLSVMPMVVVRAETLDSPGSKGSLDIPGSSTIKRDATPDEVSKEAGGVRSEALSEMEKKDIAKKKADCMAANPGQGAYCDCVANGGIKLNTDIPFVGRCINKTDTSNAFPALIGGISKMVVTAILIISFMFIIIGGVQRASGNPKEGKAKIVKVAIGLAILGASGAILALINPNFFK